MRCYYHGREVVEIWDDKKRRCVRKYKIGSKPCATINCHKKEEKVLNFLTDELEKVGYVCTGRFQCDDVLDYYFDICDRVEYGYFIKDYKLIKRKLMRGDQK